MPSINEIDNILGGAATSQSPSLIQKSSGGFAPSIGEIDKILGSPVVAPQPTRPEVTPANASQIIQGGIQQPEQRVVPGQKLEAPKDAGILQKAATGIGNFLFGSSPDILARDVVAGENEQLKNQITSDAQKTIGLFETRIRDAEASGDTARADRLRTTLAKQIQDTNDLLGNDVFQKPTTAQNVGAGLTVAANVATPLVKIPGIGSVAETVGGKALGKVAESSLAKTALRTGLESAPVGAAFGAGEALTSTGDLKDAAISAAIGAPLGFAAGAIMPPVFKGLGLFGSKVIMPTIDAIDKVTGGRLGDKLSNIVTRGIIKPLSSTLNNIGLKDVTRDFTSLFQKQKELTGLAKFNENVAVKTLDKHIGDLGETEAMRRWNEGLNLSFKNSHAPDAKHLSVDELVKLTPDPVAQDAIRLTYDTSNVGDSISAKYGKSYTLRKPRPVEGGIYLPKEAISVNELAQQLADAGYKHTDAQQIIKNVEKTVPSTLNKTKEFDMAEFNDTGILKKALEKELPNWNKIGEKPVAKIGVKTSIVGVEQPTQYLLPKELASAKTNYGYRKKLFTMKFDSDVDKALFIVAQKTPSKSDAKYMEWLKTVFPDKTDVQIRAMGNEIKASIKEVAKESTAKTLRMEKKFEPNIATTKPSKGIVKVPAGEVLGTKPMSEGPKVYLEGEKLPVEKIKRVATKAVPRGITPVGEGAADQAHNELVNEIMRNDPSVSKIPDELERRIAAEKKIREGKIDVGSYASPGIASARQYTYNTAQEAIDAGWLPPTRQAYKDMLDTMIDQNVTDAAKYESLLKHVNVNEDTGLPTNPDTRLREYVKNIVDKVATTTNAVQKSAKQGERSSTFVQEQLDSLLGQGKATDFSRAMAVVKEFSAAKLTTSAIANVFQPLNSLLAADLPSFYKGFKAMLSITPSAITKYSADEFATLAGREAGTVIEPTNFFRNRNEANAWRKFIDKIIKPFKWSEINLNRTHAANTGAFWGIDRFNKGDYKEVGRYLGLDDLNTAIKRGFLNDADLIKIGSNFMDYTQFGFNALELPTAFTDEFGSAILQFKSFSYRQAKFIIDEVKRGDAKAIRNLGVILLIYPPLGEAQEVMKRIITGKALKEGLTAQDQTLVGAYFEGMFNTGVMSLIGDMITSGGYGKGVSYIAGPTGTAIGGAIDVAGTIPKGDIGKTTDAAARLALSQFGGGGRGIYNLGKWLWGD